MGAGERMDLGQGQAWGRREELLEALAGIPARGNESLMGRWKHRGRLSFRQQDW